MMKMLLLSALVISLCYYVVAAEKVHDYDDEIKKELNEDVQIEEPNQGVKIEELREVKDCEKKLSKGDMLSMHYTGTLLSGKQFDSSRESGRPLELILGAGHVIQGLERGLVGMCPGSRRKLTIPPHLGYGDWGLGGDIPGGATLIYDVEVIQMRGARGGGGSNDITKLKKRFRNIDTDNDKQITYDELAKQIETKFEESELKVNDIISEIMKHDDKDEDGVISFNEFRTRQDPI